MITIDNSMKITMFAGDSGYFTINISRNGTPVELDSKDTIVFSVKNKLSLPGSYGLHHN
jgi:hypothetical protein